MKDNYLLMGIELLLLHFRYDDVSEKDDDMFVCPEPTDDQSFWCEHCKNHHQEKHQEIHRERHENRNQENKSISRIVNHYQVSEKNSTQWK